MKNIRKFLAVFLLVALVATSVNVTVFPAFAKSKTVKTKSIKLNKKGTITMTVGDKLTLKATVKPKKSTQKVKWSSSDKAVATVSKGGVKAKKAGKATITATSGKKKAKVTVEVVEKALAEEDIKLYTVKVHALKSSARIIGDMSLSDMCQKLENAGNEGDRAFIDAHTTLMLSDYRAYREKLAPLKGGGGKSDDREMIDPGTLKEAYDALGDVISMMDYDGAEMILSELTAYRLPPEDAEKTGKLTKLLKKLDWEGMEAVLKE